MLLLLLSKWQWQKLLSLLSELTSPTVVSSFGFEDNCSKGRGREVQLQKKHYWFKSVSRTAPESLVVVETAIKVERVSSYHSTVQVVSLQVG